MKKAKGLCAAFLYFCLIHLDANDASVSQSLSIPAISYDDSSERIQGKTHYTHVIFDPLPTTLHELYERNDSAKAQHQRLHAKLLLTLLNASNRETILKVFKENGIGIIYSPNKHLVTTHLGIHGIAGSITTSLGSNHYTE